MMERNMQLQDWLDDLCVRFLMNCPKEDLETAERICFRVEEAQWYYEDFIRPLDPNLPSMTLKRFCEEIFAHCPLLLPFSLDHRLEAFDAFLSYKKRVPVRGAIMLNQEMDKLLLVKGWKKGANWSFPRGKINKDEDDLDCAIREVYEETGFDLGEAGFVPADREIKSIELNMHEQQIRLFVFRGIPMDTNFEPRTRKEISAINWWRLSDLPGFRKGKLQAQHHPVYKATNFYMVAPFLTHVRKWIVEQKNLDINLQANNKHQSAEGSCQDELTSENDREIDSNTAINYRDQVSTKKSITSERNIAPTTHITSASSHIYQASDHSHNLLTNHTGSALLALLQRKPKTENQQVIQKQPHTPHGHDTLQVQAPQTPHHVVLNPSQFSVVLPPPKFLTNMRNEEYISSLQSHIRKQHEEMIEAPEYSHANNHELISKPHLHQSQHLIHPQPLPPHVQRAVFAQSPIPASPLDSKVAIHLNSSPRMSHVPMIPYSNKRGSTRLTDHSLALLNTFKGENHENNPNSNRPKLISKQIPESRYSHDGNSVTKIPSIKQNIDENKRGYNDIIDSSWSVLSPPKIEESTTSTREQELEGARRRAAKEQNMLEEPIIAAMQGLLPNDSTGKNFIHDNYQTPHRDNLHFQRDPWINKNEYLSTLLKHSKQDYSSKQSLPAASQEASSPISYLNKNNPLKNSASYGQQESREKTQQMQQSFVSHQPQELPANSSQPGQTLIDKGIFTNKAGSRNIDSSLVNLSRFSNELIDAYPLTHIKNQTIESDKLKRFSCDEGITIKPTHPENDLSTTNHSTNTFRENSKRNNELWRDEQTTDLIQKLIPENATLGFRSPISHRGTLNQATKQQNLPRRRDHTQGINLNAGQGILPVKHRHEQSPNIYHLHQPQALNHQKNSSLLSVEGVSMNSNISHASGSSKNLDYNCNKQFYHTPHVKLPCSKELLSLPYPDSSNGYQPHISESFAHSRSKPKTLVVDGQVTPKESQHISLTDKGFLLSYLDAVVAKGTNF